jgi:drug/metabolite transporter (DMT)-like permease
VSESDARNAASSTRAGDADSERMQPSRLVAGPRYAILRLILGAVMISFSAVFVKLATIPPTSSAFYRCAIGAILLAAFFWGRGRELWARGRGMWMVALAALFFALDLVAWHRSIVYVGPGLATLLANFQAFVLALAGVLVFGQVMRWWTMVSIPLAFVGLGMIIGFDWSGLGAQDQRGIVYGLLTALCYSGYLLSLRRARFVGQSRTPAGDLTLVSIGSALLLALFARAENASLAVHTVSDASLMLAYGVTGQVLGGVLISSALAFVSAARVGLILLLQPILSYVWDIWFFEHPMTPVQITGAVLALIAIYIGSR